MSSFYPRNGIDRALLRHTLVPITVCVRGKTASAADSEAYSDCLISCKAHERLRSIIASVWAFMPSFRMYVLAGEKHRVMRSIEACIRSVRRMHPLPTSIVLSA